MKIRYDSHLLLYLTSRDWCAVSLPTLASLLSFFPTVPNIWLPKVPNPGCFPKVLVKSGGEKGLTLILYSVLDLDLELVLRL